MAAAAGAHVHDWQGKPLDYTPRRVIPESGLPGVTLLSQQLMQQGNHLLHLILRQRAVFNPLYATVFVQHDNR